MGNFFEVVVESLEPRTFLSGVTVITHGMQTGKMPVWENLMAESIAERIEEHTGQAPSMYTLTINGKGGSLTLDEGSALPWMTGNVVVKVDWSSLSRKAGKAPLVGKQVASRLLGTPTDETANHPFAEMPLHFIGHSRGVYVNSATIVELGQRGIWTDQATTLDAQGFGKDGALKTWSTTRFADNYYQQGKVETPAGFSIRGTTEKNLVSMSGFRSVPVATRHGRVHALYHGTIDIWNQKADGHAIQSRAWYGISRGNQPSYGFNFSRYIGGARPKSGLATAGAYRERLLVGGLSLSPSEVWSNVEITSTDLSHTDRGEVEVFLRARDWDDESELILGLDTDDNPYNGRTELKSLTEDQFSGNDEVFSETLTSQTTGYGNYYVFAKIDDGEHVRFAYSQRAVYLTDYVAGPPRNDMYADRIRLTGKHVTAEGSNVNATSEPYEPYILHMLGQRRSLWWSWQAPENGRVTITAIGSGFRTRLAAYNGYPLTLNHSTYAEDSGYVSEISFFVSRGSSYEICVDGYPTVFPTSFESASGDISLFIDWSET